MNESLAHCRSLCHRLRIARFEPKVLVHHGYPLGPELAVKQIFRPLQGRRFKPRHATGKPLDPKVFEARLKARYLGDG